jgi:hypothetical protein
MPLTNRWCCQTNQERSETPSRPDTASRYPQSGLRANTGSNSRTIAKPGRARMYTSGWPNIQNRFW